MNSVDILSCDGTGYRPMVDFESWRVAVLNFCDDLLPENLTTMQRHNMTEECFILLSGSFILFSGGSSDQITDIEAIKLEPLKIYKVKKGVWHTHTLSRDSCVLIVENSNTDNTNSPVMPLNSRLIGNLQCLWQQLTP